MASPVDDLTEAEAYRDAAYLAYKNALDSQTVAHGGRTLVQHNIAQLRREWQEAERNLLRLKEPAAQNRTRARHAVVNLT